MTPPKKPDWMEIADNDGGSIKPAPVTKKSRPLLVAMAVELSRSLKPVK
jgi:hypothetical protein